ncbi:uncharacterized protein LOC118486758 [Helianthus annuus]|uniref:uncharacterized protein LOC118486758 n=1 Tax=Helianthus annuus TaxID=4232 RepID=UPI001652C6E6|nr:uncharacterized protein LOC118486758 [Helianthus annuus]
MDVQSKFGDATASVLHDRGKPPDPLVSFANKPTNVEGADSMNEPVGEELPTPGTAPIRGIGLRVTNIEGNPLIPRRGMFSTSNVSVLDGLMSISKPVENFSNGEPSTMANKVTGAVVKPMSYAESVNAINGKKVNFRSLASSVNQEGCDVVLPRESVRMVQDKLANTLYGYFLGDRVAFPVVDYFVRMNWKKYGLQKTMMNANGFFFFKFRDEAGISNVLQDGPWIIRSQPLFLNHWTPTTKLEKKEVTKVQVWVKIHEVPIAAYTEDGLSLIATTIGEPKMLDSFTTSMCMDSWGRSSYARALIEVSADRELREEITMAIPELDGEGFTKETMYVEYEWNPHRCASCCVFGHTSETCPKLPVRKTNNLHQVQNRNGPRNPKGKKSPVVDQEGYTGVYGKKAAKKTGIPLNTQKPKFEYRPVGQKSKGDSTKPKSQNGMDGTSNNNSFRSANPFDVLNEVEDEPGPSKRQPDLNDGDSDDDDVEEIYDEMDGFIMDGTRNIKNHKGASTPSPKVTNESHVDVGKLGNVCKAVFRSWDWTSNGGCCNKGTRIIIGWNPAIFDVMIVAQSPQVMHLQLVFKLDKRVLFCSIVYADNYYVTRRELWHLLSMHKVFVADRPWCIMGDFNSALNIEDNSMGSSSISIGMRDFQECVDDIEVVDINRSGIHFTWSQKPKNGVGLLKKIDRVMGNTPFLTEYPNSVAMFKPYRLSDHCPCILSIPEALKLKPRPFKFANFLVFKPEFLEIVNKHWIINVDGVHQFRVVKKLKSLKHPLRSLLFKQGNLHKKVETIRLKLDDIQQKIDLEPHNADLRNEEAAASRDLQVAMLDEERFLKQKAKVDWLSAGDMNTAFFHSSLKIRNHCSRIDIIKDTQGNLYEGDNVFKAFVQHYEKFFGNKDDISLQPTPDLFPKVLPHNIATSMVRPVTEEEVKKAMFSIGNDKAPGPDGFTAAFFKNAWPLIGNDIVNAIKDFFDTGNLLRELNHTLIVLIPKVPTPMVVTDFRPIACCNVLYKCISKIIADRIKGGLNEIVSINQSAFVPGRKISDNILLTQELMHNYHRNVGPPRCAFKVDIQKAYDTVDWRFLKSVLRGFGFNDNMVRWIMMCVSSTSFSVCVNGMVHGFFRGKRGLRQGDPISPYLFTLVMEVLTGILQHSVRIDSSFKYHNRCEKQQIINLCFADDLFLFARGEVNSANCIMTSLSKFSKMSGLVPNNQKSTVFFCNVKDHVKQEILDIMPFVEGTLPVKYLGVPLISSTLRYSDCRVLVEKLEKRIMHWKNKLLSFAGRLQLIISVLSSMHIYWSSVFLLPVRVVKELEARMRNFLWSQDVSFNRGKAKVSWKVVCTPKYEGGLGIRRIGDMNKALMASHIWSIVMKRDSLWVKWVHSYRLKGKNFWVCKATSNSTWSRRKIIQLRHVIRKYVWSDVGNGRDTSAWFDFWSDLGPLGDFLSPRTITDADFRLDDTVFNIFSNDTWNWPVAWRDLFPVLIQLDHFRLDPSKSDRLLWKDGNECQDFSSSAVWHSVRHRESEVDWSGIVWFAQCIPRHAFMMWLIMKRKLLTQDKILQWDFSRRKNMNMMCCLLCYENFDSHQHLFFECKFSDEVWNMIRGKVGMEAVCSRWADITEWLCARIRSKKVEIYVAKLLVAAAAYTIWQERNARLFRNQLRPPEMVKDAILKTVRYKLMGAKLKINARVRKLLGDWDVATETKDDGG